MPTVFKQRLIDSIGFRTLHTAAPVKLRVHAPVCDRAGRDVERTAAEFIDMAGAAQGGAHDHP
jgi:hypothetical protein